MFEYLMPLLVMPTYENTLLDQTYRAVVRRQIDYGRQRGVPWGISESGYNTIDAAAELSVPGVRRSGPGAQARPRRGPGHRAVRQRPGADGRAGGGVPQPASDWPPRAAKGTYGLYEAIDYTPSRLPPGASFAIVRQFMAHHEGMSLLSLGYLLARQADAAPLRSRSDAARRRPAAAGARAQGRAPVFPHVAEAGMPRGAASPTTRARCGSSPIRRAPSRGASALQWPVPRGGHARRRRLQPLARPGRDALARRRDARLLGHVLLSARSGERRCLVDGVATDAQAGQALPGDLHPGPRRVSPRATSRIDTHTEISVSPEDDIELRRITITNRSEVAADDRSDQLCGGGPGPPGPGPGPPGVQQPVRADGAGATDGRPFSAPAGRARPTNSRPGWCT